MVEIDAGHHPHGGIRLGGCAEHAAVGADIRSGPVGREVERIGENSLLPSLQREVGAAEAGVFEGEVPGGANDVAQIDFVLRGGRIGDLRDGKRCNESCEEEERGAAPPRRQPRLGGGGIHERRGKKKCNERREGLFAHIKREQRRVVSADNNNNVFNK